MHDKTKKILILFLAVTLMFAGVSSAQTITTLDPFKVSGTVITPRNSALGMQVPSLASAGLCLVTNASGTFSAAACSSGGGITTSSPATAGYFPYWATGSSLTGTSSIFQLGSNIGIGTSTPASLLTVGNGVFTVSNTGTVRSATTINAASGVSLENSNSNFGSGTYNFFRPYMSSPSASTEISTGKNLYINMDADNNDTTSTITFGTNANGTSATALMTIQENGNVGIGTAAPNALFHLNGGDFYVMNNGGSPRFLFGDSVAGGNWGGLQWSSANDYISMGTDTGGLGTLVVTEGSNVGVGTTTPAYKLDVKGTARFSSSTSAYNLTVTGTAGGGSITIPHQSSNPPSPAAGNVLIHGFTTQGFTRLEQDNESATNVILGRDLVTIARNNTSSTLLKGQLVMIDGSTGNVPNVELAQANASGTMPALYVVVDNIESSAFGQIMRNGILTSIDTSAFASGAPLWLSTSTAGGMTATRPSGPNAFVQRVGTVLVSGVGNGSIDVSITPAVLNMETGTVNPTFNIGGSDAVTKATNIKSKQWLGYYGTSTTIWDDPFSAMYTTSTIEKVIIGVKNGSVTGNIYYSTSQTSATSSAFKLFSTDQTWNSTTTGHCYTTGATSTACSGSINASSTPGIHNWLRFVAYNASTTALTSEIFYKEN